MVGIMPLYKPRIPPSVRYILTMVCHIPGNFPSRFPNAAKPADCIDNRVRTMSSGYVNVTDVIPAKPPHSSLRTGGRSAPGDGSANYRSVSRRGQRVQSKILHTLL